jgi:hypothetical protein
MSSMIAGRRAPDIDPDWQPLAEVARRFKVSTAHVRRLCLLHRVDWMRGTDRVGDRSPIFISCRSMERRATKRREEEYDPSCC